MLAGGERDREIAFYIFFSYTRMHAFYILFFLANTHENTCIIAHRYTSTAHPLPGCEVQATLALPAQHQDLAGRRRAEPLTGADLNARKRHLAKAVAHI